MDSNPDTEIKKKKRSLKAINHPRKENFAFNFFFYQSDIADQASW